MSRHLAANRSQVDSTNQEETLHLQSHILGFMMSTADPGDGDWTIILNEDYTWRLVRDL